MANVQSFASVSSGFVAKIVWMKVCRRCWVELCSRGPVMIELRRGGKIAANLMCDVVSSEGPRAVTSSRAWSWRDMREEREGQGMAVVVWLRRFDASRKTGRAFDVNPVRQMHCTGVVPAMSMPKGWWKKEMWIWFPKGLRVRMVVEGVAAMAERRAIILSLVMASSDVSKMLIRCS